jgi:polyhydroxybutyrate depolymerase
MPLAPGRHTIAFTDQGFERTAAVEVPAREGPLPVVLVLHGAGSEGARYLDADHWGRLARQYGFIAAAPDGLPWHPHQPARFRTNPRLWNSGQLEQGSPRTGIDDVAYCDRLLDRLSDDAWVDRDRISLVGHSNGGGMAFRLLNDRAETYRAAGVVAGQLPIQDPRPRAPRPVTYIIGAEDPLLPLSGGMTTSPWGPRRTEPVWELLERWAGAMRRYPGAGGETGRRETVDPATGVRRYDYLGLPPAAPLIAYVIPHHGHGWPGGASYNLPESVIGPISRAFDAAAVLAGWLVG